MKKFFSRICERIAYWSLRQIIMGYATTYAAGLAHVNSRQSKFESESKELALQLTQACLKLDARLRAVESREVL